MKSGVIGADGVLMTLMKQIAGAFTHRCKSCYVIYSISLHPVSNLRQSAGGDISIKNLWLAESVLEILVEQRWEVLSQTACSVIVALWAVTTSMLIDQREFIGSLMNVFV